MQFFGGSVDRKIPLVVRVQQSEQTGAVRCLQEDVTCLTHLVPDHSLYGSELQQSPWETNTCLGDGESNTAAKRPQEENMKLAERKKRQLQKSINWNKFFPWLF